ncbi:putative Zn-dependent protease [Loktanella ponticola]|uniref:Putative Zn-dependent protease n=1 Tax=Yoonia ponticola TaxID=1524255 RepID=A0A7W9BIM1_9RHOB|nr:M48 family metallopeptidase [Yoonia ponticola]MBB5720932.1 putative Zn-dependent protease [Yoonia ponticola]
MPASRGSDGDVISKVPATAPEPTPASGTTRDIAYQAIDSFVQVVQTVEPIAESECRARAPNANCDFRIVVDDRVGLPPNAYQTLDDAGRPIIAFTIPLIVEVRNRDEMAFILAHEAAHHIEGHLMRQRQNADVGAAVFGQLAGVIGGSNPEAILAAQEFGAALGARTYSKDFELEADALGTIIAATAGYNPLRGADFFFRIPDPGNSFLGTHPANADRVATVQRTAARFGY